MGALGGSLASSRPKGGEGRGKGGTGWSLVQSVGRAKEGLPAGGWTQLLRGKPIPSFKHSGPCEQRQSMVLELYCRKAGEREKVERGREAGHGHVERGWKGEREGWLESKKGESLKRARRGQAAPFIVGWAILLLPGNCGEEHTWL